MGVLRLFDAEQQIVLPSRCLIGRAPACDLVLRERNVSNQHATLAWTGAGWVLQDLGSRNGTYVDGSRLGPDLRAPLRRGATIRFGRESPSWTLVDDGAPVVMAQRLGPGSWRFGEGGYLPLPDAAEHECAILQAPDGGWVVERGSEVTAIADRATVSAGGEPWRIFLPLSAPGTEKEGGVPRILAALRLRFRHSLDEEQVEMAGFLGEERLDFGIRTHHYPLLVLARRRLADRRAGLAEADEGWVSIDDLLRMLDMNEPHLNICIHRARSQLGAAGVVDAASLIERMSRTRRIRVGVAQFEFGPLDST